MSTSRSSSQGIPEGRASGEGYISNKHSWFQALALKLAIAAAVGVALYTLRPPDVVPTNAPTTEFSAERAMEDLEAIADEPRPVGSQEHAQMREYLLAQIRAL